jgi:hypothetical protein
VRLVFDCRYTSLPGHAGSLYFTKCSLLHSDIRVKVCDATGAEQNARRW